MAVQLWEVVGGADRGGIIVREGIDLSSAQVSDRLSTGAVVQELTLSGERLNYQLVSGSGPASGWVSLRLRDKELLARCARKPPLAQPERGFFESFDGERISYLDYSPSDRVSPVVINLHGVGSEAGISREVSEQLSRAGFRVVCPDFRGHGQSAKPTRIRSWEKDAEARDVAGLASYLKLERYSCIAYSHGAIEALRLASLDDRLRCLVIGGMGHHCLDPDWDRPNQWPVNDEWNAVEADFKAVSAVANGWSEKARADARAHLAKSFHKRVMACVQRGQACISKEELARFSIPVKLVSGDRDLENGDGRKLAAMIPGCEVQFVPGGDHHHTNKMNGFWTAVAQFLEQHPPIALPALHRGQPRDVPTRDDGSPLPVSRYYGTPVGYGDPKCRRALQESLQAANATLAGPNKLKIPDINAGVLSSEQLGALMRDFEAALR